MEWYNYMACFFAGAFLANTVPHFVKGISGDKFPTPFAKPPGQGLSSPTVNMAWSLVNLVIAYLLIKAGPVTWDNNVSVIIAFAGIAVMGILMSVRFSTKHKE